jgi:acyl carrier protein
MLGTTHVHDRIHEQIRELLRESDIETGPLTGKEQLHELGLTSLMLARLVIELEMELDVDPFAEDVVISDVRSVGDLVAVYQRACADALEDVA